MILIDASLFGNFHCSVLEDLWRRTPALIGSSNLDTEGGRELFWVLEIEQLLPRGTAVGGANMPFAEREVPVLLEFELDRTGKRWSIMVLGCGRTAQEQFTVLLEVDRQRGKEVWWLIEMKPRFLFACVNLVVTSYFLHTETLSSPGKQQ
ncbi:hypothetical protein EDD22DRAFT_843565 [Suillus occidentalis]|nr:hypothetical protein EDD22DRAFT_843565 [Suillus occidentalis]